MHTDHKGAAPLPLETVKSGQGGTRRYLLGVHSGEMGLLCPVSWACRASIRGLETVRKGARVASGAPFVGP